MKTRDVKINITKVKVSLGSIKMMEYKIFEEYMQQMPSIGYSLESSIYHVL